MSKTITVMDNVYSLGKAMAPRGLPYFVPDSSNAFQGKFVEQVGQDCYDGNSNGCDACGASFVPRSEESVIHLTDPTKQALYIEYRIDPAAVAYTSNVPRISIWLGEYGVSQGYSVDFYYNTEHGMFVQGAYEGYIEAYTAPITPGMYQAQALILNPDQFYGEQRDIVRVDFFTGSNAYPEGGSIWPDVAVCVYKLEEVPIDSYALKVDFSTPYITSHSQFGDDGVLTLLPYMWQKTTTQWKRALEVDGVLWAHVPTPWKHDTDGNVTAAELAQGWGPPVTIKVDMGSNVYNFYQEKIQPGYTGVVGLAAWTSVFLNSSNGSVTYATAGHKVTFRVMHGSDDVGIPGSDITQLWSIYTMPFHCTTNNYGEVQTYVWNKEVSGTPTKILRVTIRDSYFADVVGGDVQLTPYTSIAEYFPSNDSSTRTYRCYSTPFG